MTDPLDFAALVAGFAALDLAALADPGEEDADLSADDGARGHGGHDRRVPPWLPGVLPLQQRAPQVTFASRDA